MSNGFFIPLYKNLAQQTVTGYLYCCSVCNNVLKVITKDEKLECPKCKAKIEDTEDTGQAIKI